MKSSRRLIVAATAWSFAALAAWTAAPAAADPNTFHSPTAGFSITKPTSWRFLSARDIEDNRERVELDDKKIDELVKKRANAPLVAFSRYGMDYDDLNPGVQVLLRPLGVLADRSPVDILTLSVSGLKRAYRDFRYVKEVHATRIDGLPAATMTAQYSVASTSGRRFDVLSRMWVVPRGRYVFLISCAGPPDGPDRSDGAFQEIIDSIRIER